MKHLETIPFASIALLVALSATAGATTYEVGPGRTYETLDALPALAPGDLVLLDGGATYDGVKFRDPGTAAAPIVIKGVRKDGARPIIRGDQYTVEMAGDHYVFEGLEITGATKACVLARAADLTIRDTLVRDCEGHGILGMDEDTGSLTLEYSEVYGTGKGERMHQIYVATDQHKHPGAVFRMQHSYVHDATGGHNVKSRAERNEIYYNWIEGAEYHELELIGPALGPEDLRREDSDVVGNVIRKTGGNAGFNAVRVGGDGTGQTWGRYRFVNNTFLLQGGAAFRLFDGLESVEMHNNVFHSQGGAPMVRDYGVWKGGAPVIAGSHNWVSTGTSDLPETWTETITGDEPGFADAAKLDLRPRADSPLVDVAQSAPPGPAGHDFPEPLDEPVYLPPNGALEPLGSAAERPVAGPLDIGAIEHVPAGGADPNLGDDAGGSPWGALEPGASPSGVGDPMTGGCNASPADTAAPLALVALLLGGALMRRRQRR